MCMRINYQPVTEPAIMDGFGPSLSGWRSLFFPLSFSLSLVRGSGAMKLRTQSLALVLIAIELCNNLCLSTCVCECVVYAFSCAICGLSQRG